MIALLEKGLADYLAAALASPQPTVVVRPETSSETLDRTRPLVYVRLSTQFIPGSETHALGNAEIVVMTLVGGAGNTATVHAAIEAAVLTAMRKSNLAAMSAAVFSASGYDVTGLVWEGFKEGADKQFWQPYLPVTLSLVKHP